VAKRNAVIVMEMASVEFLVITVRAQAHGRGSVETAAEVEHIPVNARFVKVPVLMLILVEPASSAGERVPSVLHARNAQELVRFPSPANDAKVRDTSQCNAAPVKVQDYGSAIPVMADVGFLVIARMEGCYALSAMANASVNAVVEV